MPDNIELSAGSGGSTVATDDDGTAHHQYVKVEFGADNTQTKVTAAAGLPVTPDSGGFTVALSATDNAVLDTIDAVLDTINAKLVTGTVIGDTNAIQSGTWTVDLGATDNAVLDSIDAAVNGTLAVSGTVTANLSATDNAVLDTIDAVLDTINAKLVSGTVIGDVNLGATDNAVLDSIVTNTTGLAGTVSGSELQVDVVASLPAGTNAIGKLSANSGVDIGDVDVTSISAGSNLVGDVGISGARTSGGTTLYKNIDVDESEDQVKGTTGQVYWIHAINLTAAPLYLKFYNATAATVTVGTTVPDLTFPVPGNADSDGAGFTLSIPNGIAFSTAITIAGTTGVADNNSGAPGANELIVNLGYA